MKLFQKKARSPVRCAGFTDVGKVRENNEDCFFFDEQLRFFVVADGMGGHNAGEVASRLVVDHLQAQLKAKVFHRPESDYERLLKDQLIMSHQVVLKGVEEDPARKGMGCAVVVACMEGNHLHTCHVGDARVYIANEQGIQQLGTDHSVVAQSVKAGLLTPEEARMSQNKNQLTMAIGGPTEVEPEYVSMLAQAGDRIILCSDGLWDMVPDQRILELALRDNDAEQITGNLMKEALEAGGHDNVSIITYIVP